VLDALGRFGSAVTGLRLPGFNPALSLVPKVQVSRPREGAEVVYVPSCLSRIMGRPRGEEYSVPEVILRVADRAGVKVFTPKAVGLCCGLPWGSKGFATEHGLMAGKLVDALWEWTDEGRLPTVLDASSCLQGLRYAEVLLQGEQQRRLRALKLLDGPEFARDALLPKLTPTKRAGTVALHPNCAAIKLGTASALEQVARACAEKAVTPSALGCCGTAGDRGLSYPELPASATLAERTEVEAGSYTGYYSSNLTCETGLRQSTGLPYRSVFYLLDEATDPARRGG
jgi:D-lactate dehydrogenase